LRQKLYLSPEAHSLSLSYRLYGQLAYHIVHSSWNLAQLEALEQPINAFYRMRTRNLPTFPTHLLYAPTSHGGLGLTRLTTRCHYQRHGIIHHFLNSPSSAWIVDSLIGRLFRSSHLITTPGFSQQLTYLHEDSTDKIANPTFWARSTAQLALTHDQCLSSPGICPISTFSSVQSLWDFFPDTPEAIRHRYTAAGLHSVGDIMDPTTSEFLDLDTLPRLPLAGREPPLFHNYLRTEQCWRHNDNKHIFEIHSLSKHSPGDPFIHVRWWVIPTPTSKPRAASSANHVVLEDTGFGYFDPNPYTYDELFPPGTVLHRVILEADLNNLDGTPLPKTHRLRRAHPNKYIRLTHGEYESHRPMIPDSLLTTTNDLTWHLGPAAELPPCTYTTYTDGSWKREPIDPLTDILFPNLSPSSGGGAVVLLANDLWHQHFFF